MAADVGLETSEVEGGATMPAALGLDWRPKEAGEGKSIRFLSTIPNRFSINLELGVEADEGRPIITGDPWPPAWYPQGEYVICLTPEIRCFRGTPAIITKSTFLFLVRKCCTSTICVVVWDQSKHEKAWSAVGTLCKVKATQGWTFGRCCKHVTKLLPFKRPPYLLVKIVSSLGTKKTRQTGVSNDRSIPRGHWPSSKNRKSC